MDVRLPDGTIIKNVPDDFTKAQLVEKLKANGMDVSKFEAPAAPTKPSDATAGERVQAGVGGVNRGLAGLAGLPVDTVENIVNLGIAAYGAGKQAITGKPGPDLIQGSVGGSQYIADKLQGAGINTQNPRPDDPASRMLHTAGVVAGGSVVPGARPMPTALAAGTAAVAGETLGPQWAAPAAMAAGGFGQAVQSARQKSLLARQEQNAARDQAVAQAREAGYTLPPTQANPSWWNRALEGFAGKLTTAQHASAKNQQITNILAKRSLGLPDDAPLSEKVLNDIRTEAGKSYQAVKEFGGGRVKFRPDSQFKQEIDSIGGDFAKAAKEFPELAQVKAVDDLKAALQRPISPAAAVEIVKKLRKDSSTNFKSFDNPEKLALAKAQRYAADSIEGLVERNLAKSGQGDLVRDFREARTKIARTYDIESALNDASGNVSAKAIAKLADKGKPLGGDTRKIADFASSFPKAAQTPEQMGSLPGMSPLDFMFGGAGYFLNPSLAAMAAARPGVRAGILSAPYQNRMGPSYTTTPAEDDLALLLRSSVLANQR
jgi:hypothetical protein